MPNHKVSVIIPCYNSAKTIERAVKSVRLQTHQPYEILIYDDASTDKSLDILVKLAIESPLIKIFKGDTNKGAGFSRQFLLDKTQGNLIAFLDSDDVWYPEKLKLQIMKLVASDADICICDYKILDGQNREIGVRHMPKTVSHASLHLANWIPTSMVLFRKEITQNQVMSEIRTRQDYAYWLMVFKAKADIKCVSLNKVLGNYYRDNTGISRSTINNIRENFRMFRNIFGYSTVTASLCVILNGITRLFRA